MRLSTKGRYAVMALVDLASHSNGRPVALADISGRQEISLSYLEQLFAKLRRGGLVKSVRAMTFDDILTGGQQELRRGTVVLACLLLLRKPGYGYALLEELRDLGFAVDANTLYPLLRRLEGQGMLVSEWNTQEARPRKFYRISPDGERLAAALLADWMRIDASVRRLGQGGPTA